MNRDGIHRRREWMTRWAVVGLLVFQHGYVRAMHPTLTLPVAAAFVAAALCLLATRHTTSPQAGGPTTSPTTEGASAAGTG